MRHINAGLENDRFRQSDTVGNTGAGHGKVAASGTRLNTYEAPTPRTHGGSNGTWVRRIAADAGKPCIDSGGDNDPASEAAIPKLGQFSYAPSPNFTTQRFASLRLNRVRQLNDA